jgi:hypothetical protein
MTVSIVLFDLGRVVLDWEPSRLYDKIFDNTDARDHFLDSVCTMAWHMRHDAGVSFADNADALIADHPEHESEIRAWGRRWMEMFDGYIDGTPDLIERLHARYVPLYALTNMPTETWPLMQQHFGPLLDRFPATSAWSSPIPRSTIIRLRQLAIRTRRLSCSSMTARPISPPPMRSALPPTTSPAPPVSKPHSRITA